MLLVFMSLKKVIQEVLGVFSFEYIYQETRKVDSKKAKLCNTRDWKKSKPKETRKKVVETRAYVYKIE